MTFSDNRVAGDDITENYTAAFFDKNAGTGKTVSVTGITLSGADAGNYTVVDSTTSTTANIAPRTLAVSATGVNKVYDSMTVATVTLADSPLPGDQVTAGYASAAFADKNVGTGKAVSVTGISLSGSDAADYTLTSTTANTTANITPRTLTVSATGLNRVYDGTTTATVSLADDRAGRSAHGER